MKLSFEEQLASICDRYDTRIALSDASTKISYRQLYKRVCSTASLLRAEGVCSGARVGLICPRSPELIILMLGLLSIEAAYVPIDPAYPSALIDRSIKAARLDHAIVGENVASALVDVVRTSGVSMHAATPLTTIVDVNGVRNDVRMHNPLAYAICTSGSSGNPKVVAVALESLIASTDARTKFYGHLRGPFNNLLVSSVAFDSSVGVIFGSLFAGDELFLAADSDIKDPRRLLELIVRENITSLLMLPSYGRVLYELDESGAAFARLKRLIFAGERVLASDAEEVHRRAPHVHVYNEYGPTEAVVWATAMRLQPGNDWKAAVPIGRAVAHVETHILDDELRHAPDGLEGELYIGGASIASGYINDPGETAKCFTPDPFSQRRGGRLYKTGDRALVGPDGHIVFIGRADRQVKLHGYRIELGEIEAVAMSVAGVREAAAVYAPAAKNHIELFVVTDLEPKGIRDQLQHQLPVHMVPARIELVETLPLLPNGKVDYEAIAGWARSSQSASAEAPANASLLLKIRQIWETVLHKPDISLDEDFFELGGNSIKAAMIANRVQRLLKCRLYVGQLFEQPTIRGLGLYLSSSFPVAVGNLEQE